MKTLRRLQLIVLQLSLTVGFALMSQPTLGQAPGANGSSPSGGPGKPVTIPVTIRVKEET
jgi:hypothetical protein